MPVVDVLIARSRYEVFDFATAATNLPMGDSSIMETEHIDSGSVGVGTRWRVSARYWGAVSTEYGGGR
jgi:hypothetical protein